MPREPRTVFVVPGEEHSAHALARRVVEELGWAAVVPQYGERVRVD